MYLKLVEAKRVDPLLSSEPVRAFLMQEGGVLDRVVAKSLNQDEDTEQEESAEDRVMLTGADLPVEHWESELTAENQREVKATVSLFRGKPEFLAELLNGAIQESVQSTLRKELTVESTEALLVDVRRAIARAHPGRELVLLIEDLAGTQFIDEDLVKACSADGAGGTVDMAPMRTLFATTLGLFERLQQSTLQRVTGKYMLGHDWERSEHPWLAFGSNYLALFRKDGPDTCLACDYKASCFSAFGSDGEKGFYPFTPTLLAAMAARAAGAGRSAFHPRTFLRQLAESSSGALADVAEARHPRPSFSALETIEVGDQGQFAMFVEGLGLGADLERAKRALRAYGTGLGGDRRIGEAILKVFALPAAVGDGKPLPQSLPPGPVSGGESTGAGEQKPETAPDPEAAPVPTPLPVPTPVPVPSKDPITQRIIAWQGGEEDLAGPSEQSLQKAARGVLLGAPHFWEIRQVPKLVRSYVLADRSFVFRSSASAESQGQPLAVRLMLPAQESEVERSRARQPFRMAFELDMAYGRETSQAKVDFIGWPAREDGQFSAGDYLRLCKAQDDVSEDIARQVEDVLGSTPSAGATAIEALISGAAQQALDATGPGDSRAGQGPPVSLDAEAVVHFLKELKEAPSADWSLSTRNQDALKPAPMAKACLHFLGSWKGKDAQIGDAVLLDLYKAEAVVGQLTQPGREFPADLQEAKGRHLGQVIDHAKGLRGRLEKGLNRAVELQERICEAYSACGLPSWDPAIRGEVAAELEALSGLEIGSDARGLERLLADLTDLEGNHAADLLFLSEGLADRDYPTLARCVRVGLAEAVELTENVLVRIGQALAKLERDYPPTQGGSDVQDARAAFEETLQQLVDAMQAEEVD